MLHKNFTLPFGLRTTYCYSLISQITIVKRFSPIIMFTATGHITTNVCSEAISPNSTASETASATTNGLHLTLNFFLNFTWEFVIPSFYRQFLLRTFWTIPLSSNFSAYVLATLRVPSGKCNQTYHLSETNSLLWFYTVC